MKTKLGVEIQSVVKDFKPEHAKRQMFFGALLHFCKFAVSSGAVFVMEYV